MRFAGHRVVVTGAGRGFGRSLAIELARDGAELFLSARRFAAAEDVAEEVRHVGGRAHAFECDLADAESVRDFVDAVGEVRDTVDVLVNNGAPYLDAGGFLEASDEEVAETIAAGAAGTVLATKAFLPLLLRSERPDIVTLVSGCGEYGNHRSTAHEAFYAAKAAQAGFTEVLSKRLRPRGVRVMSLYPPDFDNPDPLSDEWDAERNAGDALSARSLVETVRFAIGQPRDCFIKSFYFEQA
ncbi:SDR family oxidoreductase [Glycomyces sp. TRM65418]|uniref:SDR family oxidoreductase n=1 Tax=Glycomyces sp. TRM65418 TaxID=2867006 RepID=UPI001CE5E58E|nr:SDR family NAD(P)-dependent oxidoreductase [Glycomyces sp. TRM65418]MCC3765484.1 SDR family oxidoreductase [Glycomyces sp. TRM65418]QZD55092.1 SDR family oxidoreductase [Glycomyces sp. TRM65418]